MEDKTITLPARQVRTIVKKGKEIKVIVKGRDLPPHPEPVVEQSVSKPVKAKPAKPVKSASEIDDYELIAGLEASLHEHQERRRQRKRR